MPIDPNFFIAWSQQVSVAPIRTQTFSVDTRQQRQFIDWYAKPSDIAFAEANRGYLYIIGDEPDQFCMKPEEYAGIYHASVESILIVDPTARFSPAGFAEPNAVCAIAGTPNKSWDDAHSIAYAQKFVDAYVKAYRTQPPVTEWRFHDFGLTTPVGDLQTWFNKVDRLIAWSVSHGAPMYLGSWGFHSWNEPIETFLSHLSQAMTYLSSHPNLVGAAWWSYEPWTEAVHPLFDGVALTPTGRVYAGQEPQMPEDRLTKLEEILGLKFVGMTSEQLNASLIPNNAIFNGRYPLFLSDFQIRVGIQKLEDEIKLLKLRP